MNKKLSIGLVLRLNKFMSIHKTLRHLDEERGIIEKIFNRGLGSIPFLRFYEKDKILLVNTCVSNKMWKELLRDSFPEYNIKDKSFGYPAYYTETFGI